MINWISQQHSCVPIKHLCCFGCLFQVSSFWLVFLIGGGHVTDPVLYGVPGRLQTAKFTLFARQTPATLA